MGILFEDRIDITGLINHKPINSTIIPINCNNFPIE